MSFSQALERWWTNLVSTPQPTRSQQLCRAILRLLSFGYHCAVHWRNQGYDRGWFKQIDAGLPVISVGNIAVGGTGKTPLTLHLARVLSKKCKVAIVSRGYRSIAERSSQPVIVSRGEKLLCSWQEAGDEPCLLAQQLPGVLVIAGRDRSAGVRLAKREGAQMIILDDGLQHRRLQRQVDIVVLDGNDPFGGGALLPRGRLRDVPETLQHAQWIVVTHRSHIDPVLSQRIRQYTSAPIVAAQLKVRQVEDIANNQLINLHGKRVAVFCGIGSPKNFLSTIEKMGATVVNSMLLGDHRSLSMDNLTAFAEQSAAQGAELLVCTAKDRVKLPDIGGVPAVPSREIHSGNTSIGSCKLPIASVEVDLSFGEGSIQWNDWVNSGF
jgi:tetraacyldisaccharide 4'-kinase